MSPHHPSAREKPAAPAPLPIAVVDNHVHLDIAREGEQAPTVQTAIAESTAVGVPRLVQIGCDLPGARFTVDAIDRHPALLGGVALHPNEIPRLMASGGLDAALAEIDQLAVHPRVRVIGETGLDYFRTGADGIPAQQEAFRWHIDLAKRTGKALQIHDRDAHADVLRILDEEGIPERTVLHCFSGDLHMARIAVERGLMLSYSGTVTFKNAGDLRNALSVTPLEHLLVETDAPYLAPVPRRGKRNEPAFVMHTAAVLAGLREMPPAALHALTTRNFHRLFSKAAGDRPDTHGELN